MIHNLLIILALLYFSIASYTDIKKRIVSNKLTLSFAAAGLVLQAIKSIQINSFEPILFSLASAAILFTGSFVLWKIGLWAAGDVKLFTALAVLLPLSPELAAIQLPRIYSQIPIFSLSVLTNSILLAFPFISGYVLLKANKQKVKQLAKKTVFRTSFVSLTAFGFGMAFEKTGLPVSLTLLVLLGFAFLPKKLKLVPGAIASVTSLYFFPNVFSNLLTSFIATGVFIAFLQSLSLKDDVLRKKVETSNLREGDILAFTLVETDGELKRVERPSLSEAFSNPDELKNFLFPKNAVASSKDAAGLSEEQLKKIKESGLKEVSLKSSVPFVPILFAGLVISVFVGDLLWILVSVSPKLF